MSPEPSRGFSGEGQTLYTLALGGGGAMGAVRRALRWQSRIDPAGISAASLHRREEVDRALAACAASGLVGFDLADRAFFHRELPFDLSRFSPDWTATDPLLRAGTAVPDLLAWASLVWPSNREGWCALGAFRIANNLDWDSADWSNRVFLAVFEDRYCEMGRMAHLLLALGLMAREATEFDRARDGLIRIIGDGRLNCEWLGAALAELFASGVVRGGRLAKALTETARVSARHADAVRQVTESALGPGLPARPADQSALLEAFLEACTASGAGPASGDLRRLLESVTGSGKGPKTGPESAHATVLMDLSKAR